MKRFYILLVALIAFYACQSDKKSVTKTKAAQIEEIELEDADLMAYVQGEYQGELPCEDCKSLHFKVYIGDHNYNLKYAKEGGDQKTYHEEGRFFIENGVLELQSEENEWRFKVGDGKLYMLNFENRILEDAEVEKYVIKKY